MSIVEDRLRSWVDSRCSQNGVPTPEKLRIVARRGPLVGRDPAIGESSTLFYADIRLAFPAPLDVDGRPSGKEEAERCVGHLLRGLVADRTLGARFRRAMPLSADQGELVLDAQEWTATLGLRIALWTGSS